MMGLPATSVPLGEGLPSALGFFHKAVGCHPAHPLAGAPAVFAGPATSDTSGRSAQTAADSSKQDLSILPNALPDGSFPAASARNRCRTIDHAQSAALREYGFTGYEIATYSQGKRKLTVRAARSRMPPEPTALLPSIARPARMPNKLGTWLLPTMTACFFSGAPCWWKPVSIVSPR